MNGHKFMQDNDPKHTSLLAQTFLEEKEVRWCPTPPESPDFNPIENMWHELKEYLRREVKPRTKEELVSGIQEFWNTVTAAKCQKYIRHLLLCYSCCKLNRLSIILKSMAMWWESIVQCSE